MNRLEFRGEIGELTCAQAIDANERISFGGMANEARPTAGGVRSKEMKKLVTRFAKDESGATAIEYGLIAALISVVIIGVLSTLGTRLNSKFTQISNQLQ
jgi:pilus assembly protein Flp/PilA